MNEPMFPAGAIRHPSRWKMRWHRLVSLGRRHRTVEEGIAVEWYRTRRDVLVILDSFPASPEAEDLWRGWDAKGDSTP